MISQVWRGCRYWTMEPKAGEQIGWNTRFEPYKVVRVTAKRITVTNGKITLQLNRQAFESTGKVYHSRVAEYFYREKPFVDPESRYYKKIAIPIAPTYGPFVILGLSYPCSKADIKRAYRNKAKVLHPDSGGSHDEFTRLQSAYEDAMRMV
jgi:hypothetical protein